MSDKEKTISSWESFNDWINTRIEQKIEDLKKYIKDNNFNDKNVKLFNSSQYLHKTRRKGDANFTNISLNPENQALFRIFERIFSIIEAGKTKKEIFKTIYAFPPHT